jgi:O-antigen/teichoic acid export membrane protein
VTETDGPRLGPLVRLARRAGWGVADQALSSLTNFALGIAVARVTSPSEFGAYGLVFIGYLLGLNIARPLAMDPLVIRYSGSSTDRWRTATRSATGLVFVVGIVGSIICLPVILIDQAALGTGFLALAFTFPGLLVQDGWRFAFFAAGRGRSAFANDLVWALVLGPLVALVVVLGLSSVFAFVLAWGVAATIAAIVGVLQSGVVPGPGRSRAWLREHRDLASPLVVERSVYVGQSQLSTYGIGLVSGLPAVGALRAAELILGPFNVIAQGLNLIAVPEGVRLREASMRRFVRACRGFGLGVAGAAVCLGAAIWFLPDPIGVALLGQNWEPARHVLIPYTAILAGSGLLSGSYVGLRVLAEGRRFLRIGLLVSGASLVLAIAGAAAGGAPLAAAGLAVAMWAGAVFGWWQFGQAVAHAGPLQASNDPRSSPAHEVLLDEIPTLE